MEFVQYIPAPHHLLRLTVSSLGDVFSSLKPSHAERLRLRSNFEFDIESLTGFVPRSFPSRLPRSYDFWEQALSEAKHSLALGDDDSTTGLSRRQSGESWRQRIRSGPALGTKGLEQEAALLHRAHYVLAWLVHYYVHSIPDKNPSKAVIVPRTLTVPLVEVSRILGIAPVLTYADTVLWNMRPIDPSFPLEADNVRFENLFSGTDDENAFYIASLAVELRGAEILQIIEDYHQLPHLDDIALSKVSRDLYRVASVVSEMSDIMQSVRASCDPHVFYWAVRPWYCGSDAGGPECAGWIYEGIENSDRLDLSGPSAGQSPVMHALDVWLDIDHKLRQRRYPAPSEENKKADQGFMERMRRYMPATHQNYLEYLAESPRPIRDVARQSAVVREAYNAAVMALKRFRDSHVRIACLYIVSMSKTDRKSRNACPVMAAMSKEQGRAPVRGTGGTELSVLLKAGRDATRRAIIE